MFQFLESDIKKSNHNFFIKQLSFKVLLFVVGFVFSMPAHALVDQYNCAYEVGTDFGDSIEFSYDSTRNSVLLHQHHSGAGYSPKLTLGNVSQNGGSLNFELEYWANGTIAMRETLNLNLGTMIIDAAQYFYDEDGGAVGEGQTALGACSKKSGVQSAVATPIETDMDDVSSSVPNKQESPTNAAIFCHTKELGAEGPKSATYCLTSHLPPNKEHSYGPENLAQADGAWCESEVGQGIGVGIELSFQPYARNGSPPEYDRLIISNGYDKTTKTFMENSRVKKIEITSTDAHGGQTWVRALRDETGAQEVLLGGKINPYGILITILEVYPGQKYEDTCLSYIGADFGF